jgi:hypothetical protein
MLRALFFASLLFSSVAVANEAGAAADDDIADITDNDAVDGSNADSSAADDDGLLTDLQMGTFRVESASPQGRRIGVGLELGWATAATAKLMLRPEVGVRASVGAFTGLALSEPAFSLSVDWLYHPFAIARSSAWVLHTHIGAGGALVILPIAGKRTTVPAALYHRGPTQVWTGLRVPVGVDLAFTDVPVDIVFDVVPTVLTFPGIGVGMGATLGARWWW